jgi:hypothetical protein
MGVNFSEITAWLVGLFIAGITTDQGGLLKIRRAQNEAGITLENQT